jgi:predicted PurR-regulated permease PerM
MSGFAPLVDWFEKQRVNKTLAVIFTYLIAIGGLGLLLFAVVPPLIEQSRLFVAKFPFFVGQVTDYIGTESVPGYTPEEITAILSDRVNDILGNLLGLILNVFTGFLTFLSVAVFSFYLLLDRAKIKKNLVYLFPHLAKEEVLDIVNSIERKLGAWVRGQLILMFIVFLMTWLGLTLLRVEFALPLALMAGLLEAIAIVGPILAGITAFVIVVAQGNSLLVILGTAALYILIQQLENYVIVPKVMKEVVGLSPIVTILALLVGGTLFGIIGAAIAVPTAAAIQVVLVHFVRPR